MREVNMSFIEGYKLLKISMFNPGQDPSPLFDVQANNYYLYRKSYNFS